MAYQVKAVAPTDEWQIVVGLVSGYTYAKSPILRFFAFLFWGLIKLLPLGEYLRDQVEALFGHWSVERVFASWRKERAEAGQEFVTGFVDYTSVYYSSKSRSRWTKKKLWISCSEPVAVLSGSRNPLYDKDTDAYKESVLDLAKTLGSRRRQSRIYLNVLGETIIIQDDLIKRS